MKKNAISYFQILSELKTNNKEITYLDLLNTKEWKLKRELILLRDNLKCKICKISGTISIDSKPHILKDEKQLQQDQLAIDKAYEELVPIFNNFLKSLSIPSFDINKIEVEPLKKHSKSNPLHVHHLYYINGNLPWQYPDEALITLCPKCHQTLHNENDIPVYKNKSLSENLHYTKCPKCLGSGHIHEYNYYYDGICFQCNGFKYKEMM